MIAKGHCSIEKFLIGKKEIIEQSAKRTEINANEKKRAAFISKTQREGCVQRSKRLSSLLTAKEHLTS